VDQRGWQEWDSRGPSPLGIFTGGLFAATIGQTFLPENQSMTRRARERACALLAAACLAIGGSCSGGKPPVDSTTEEATVKGKVTVLGKLATKGQVTFDPTNIKRPNAAIRSAEIGADGTYQVTTLVGANSVVISVPRQGMPLLGMAPELGIDVKPGENTLDIALPMED